MTKAQTNIEGLTFAEWCAAAGLDGLTFDTKAMRAEWKAGVDPSEYRAESDYSRFLGDVLEVGIGHFGGTRHIHVCKSHWNPTKFTVFSFGANGSTYIAVGHEPGTESLEDCLEAAADLLRAVAPGCFTEPDYDEAASDLGFLLASNDEDERAAIMAHAEQDHTYTESGWLLSWEWAIVGQHLTRAELLAFARGD